MAVRVEDAEVGRYFRLKDRIDWARDVRCEQNNLLPLTAAGIRFDTRNRQELAERIRRLGPPMKPVGLCYSLVE
jgi:hypothetical protein